MVTKDNKKSSNKAKITKDMMINEVVAMYPDTIPELIGIGMHCIGCNASAFETLEEGLLMHGMTPVELDKFVDKLNDTIKDSK